MTLQWLPLSDRKTLPTVRIAYVDIEFAGGLFACRTDGRCLLQDLGLDIDRRDGDVIVLSTHWGDPHASTIAHEHRHFQQHYFPRLPRLGMVQPFDNGGDITIGGWRRGISQFYKRQRWEMDALLYSARISRDDSVEPHLDAVFSTNAVM